MIARNRFAAVKPLVLVVGLSVIFIIGLGWLGFYQYQKIATLNNQVLSLQKEGAKAGVRLTGFDQLPSLKKDSTTQSSKSYQGDGYRFDYPATWQLQEKKGTDNKVTEVDIATAARLFDSPLVAKTGGLITVRRASLSWLVQLDDYLKQTPYATKHRQFTVNKHAALETTNHLQDTDWLQTVVLGDPQEPATIITSTQADSTVALEGYNRVLQSLTVGTAALVNPSASAGTTP